MPDVSRDLDLGGLMWGITQRPQPRPRTLAVGAVHLAAVAAAVTFDVLRATAAAVAELTGGYRP